MSQNIRNELTLGPVLFHWASDQWRDFYFRIADEAPIDTVYIGEVVCAKRAPFNEPLYADVAQRLKAAGKKVVFSTLAEVTVAHDRRVVDSMCSLDCEEIEANDLSALWHLSGRPHRLGQYMNVYNEDTLAFLAARGAHHVCLPSELPASAIAVLAAKAQEQSVTLEVQVYGRVPLALSARCYHARAHGRTKDGCLFACGEDPDGMTLKTLSGEPFLSVNGIQTLSHSCLNLAQETRELATMGISAFRLSPQSHDMVRVAETFRALLDGELTAPQAIGRLKKIAGMPFSNGFFHKSQGHAWVVNASSRAGAASERRA